MIQRALIGATVGAVLFGVGLLIGFTRAADAAITALIGEPDDVRLWVDRPASIGGI